MTTRSVARHRKATRPAVGLSMSTPAARRGLSVAAVSGLALTVLVPGAVAAGDTSKAVQSAGALGAAGNTALATAREAAATNQEITVAVDADWAAEAGVEASASAPVAAPAPQEAAPAATAEAAAPAQAAATAAVPAAAADGSIAALAMQYVGSAYVYGAAGPNAFDCSGLVSYVYGLKGIALPHQSEAIAAAGTAISADQAAPGDVLWWPGHVAIYVGNGMMVSADHEGVGVVYTEVRSGATYLRMG